MSEDNINKDSNFDKLDLAQAKTLRLKAVTTAKTIVFKVGSAVLATAKGLDQELMHNLAAQMTEILKAKKGRRLVLVTSAAVAAGRAVLSELGFDLSNQGLSAKQATAAIGQARLMQAWDQAFRAVGLATAQVLLTREDLQARQRFLNVRNTFAELLQWQILPIVNENDTVSVKELKFGDNDSLASLLANLVGADLVVNLTSAKGVKAEDPSKNPEAPILKFITKIEELDLNKICGSKTLVGTGGMYSKLKAARRTAQIGVPTLILPGREPLIIKRAFETTSDLGTFVCQAKNTVPRRKYWLAYQTEPRGSLSLDQGAAHALLQEGASLLPGGITKVSGTFQKGDLVAVSFNDEEIAVGLSNYSSQELAKIRGLKRHEVAAILGNAHYPEVIHRDNLLLHAVV
ncbi:MAG: glutamate 5-kinase [Desulfovibrio sp.]|nr:glutamate 5-kinase [Desulfovibrio sp.]